MVRLGTASLQNEQAIIATIWCRLPEYLQRFLGVQYKNLYEFKSAVLCTLRNPNVEIYKRFLTGSMSFEKTEDKDFKGKRDYKGGKPSGGKSHGGKPDWVKAKEEKGEWKGKPWDQRKHDSSSESDHNKTHEAASGEAGKEGIRASMAEITSADEDDYSVEKEEARILEELKNIREERAKKGYENTSNGKEEESSGRSEISAKIYTLNVGTSA